MRLVLLGLAISVTVLAAAVYDKIDQTEKPNAESAVLQGDHVFTFSPLLESDYIEKQRAILVGERNADGRCVIPIPDLNPQSSEDPNVFTEIARDTTTCESLYVWYRSRGSLAFPEARFTETKRTTGYLRSEGDAIPAVAPERPGDDIATVNSGFLVPEQQNTKGTRSMLGAVQAGYRVGLRVAAYSWLEWVFYVRPHVEWDYDGTKVFNLTITDGMGLGHNTTGAVARLGGISPDSSQYSHILRGYGTRTISAGDDFCSTHGTLSMQVSGNVVQVYADGTANRLGGTAALEGVCQDNVSIYGYADP